MLSVLIARSPACELFSVRSLEEDVFCCGLLEGFDCLSLGDMATSVNSSNFTQDAVGSKETERKQRDGKDLWTDRKADRQTRQRQTDKETAEDK